MAPFLVVAGILFVVFILVELILRGPAPKDGRLSAKRVVAVQVEVLNGIGESKIAQKVTNLLRAGGFDVVEMGNYKTTGVEKTMVIGRTANPSAPKEVASFLGLDETRILQQPDKNLYLDVTVVIGKDIYQLKALK